MSTLVYSALTAVIFTSAAGALVMCLLVFKYGFAPSPDELPSDSVRRVFITRLGHALAGTCFAATAILAAVTLADLARRAPPTAAAVPANDRRTMELAELTLGALMSRVGAAESAVQNADERVRRVEAELRRVGDNVRKVAVSDAPPARPRVAAPPPPFFTEPPVASTPAAKPAMPNNPPPPPTVAEPRVVSPPVAKPAAPATSNHAPQPTSFAEPRLVSPVVPRAARPVPPKSPPPDDLGSRLRRDWDAVKRGFTTAPSEFNAALDEQARALRDAGK